MSAKMPNPPDVNQIKPSLLASSCIPIAINTITQHPEINQMDPYIGAYGLNTILNWGIDQANMQASQDQPHP